jgi:L-lactate dehydrogenase complex protein LldF
MAKSGPYASFQRRVHAALADGRLQTSMANVKARFVDHRAAAVARLPEFDALRDAARDVKNHTLAHLDLYLEEFETKVREAGGHVHFARTSQEAQEIVVSICRARGARSLAKGKSMVSEEIRLNPALEAAGFDVVETDLGEYIIQLRGERPSHIVAPAAHLSRAQVEAEFRRAHVDLPSARNLDDPARLLKEAREILRRKFLSADVGLTGANLLIAETGSAVIVTNEGNGDLCRTLPKTHIVLTSIEKLVPTLEDATTVLRVLARSATGQDITVYTSFLTGPRGAADVDGPEHFHVVLLDGGRSAMLGSSDKDMLRCIRCGACMNHCPVYQAIGGHAYDSIYPGPMGAVLTPAFSGLEANVALPEASTFCGRCEEVCPVRIPLPKLMRHWREREFERRLAPSTVRAGLRFWSFFALRPALYRVATDMAMRLLTLVSRRRGRFSFLPLATAWTATRDMPVPRGATFQSRWRARRRS